jgi:hypothetical protein
VQAIWDISSAISQGMPDGRIVFEPHRRRVFVGIVFPDDITSCSIGSTWHAGEWSPVRWTCP